MKKTHVLCILTILCVLGGCARGLEGTYVLTSRELPDGTVQSPPDVVGRMTLVDGQRHFNLYWKDAEGNPVSVSSISEYALSGDEYSETSLFYLANGTEFGGLRYELSPTSGASPVTRADGQLAFKLPLFDEPSVVFTSRGFTATREGAFVDHWKRID